VDQQNAETRDAFDFHTEHFDMWAVVEIMGRKVFAGRVTECVIAGAGFLRVDVPAVEALPAFTRYVEPHSVYGITPVNEAAARLCAERLRLRPVNTWELPALAPVFDAEATAADDCESDGCLF